MAARKTLTKAQGEKALRIVAEWLGPKMGCIKPCGKCPACKAGLKWDWECERPTPVPAPTGHEAAMRAEGPYLNREWDWPSSGPTPTILLEGGPYDWAVEVSMDAEVIAKMRAIDVFAEPYAGYALCLYRED